MNCHSFNNVRDLLDEGRLSPRRAAAAEAHRASCDSCRGRAPLARAAGERPRAPEALKARLRAAAAREPAPLPVRELRLWPDEAPGLALAAAALLAVGLIAAAAGVPSQSGGSAVAAAVEAP
jgi:hypothetical protein